MGERESSEINRELKEMGPQAEGVGERESSEFKRNLNGGPQADGEVERKSSGINRELKEMGPQADEVRIQVPINDD